MANIYASSLVSSGGTGTFSDPYDLQTAVDSISAGDELRVLNDGIYSLSSSIVIGNGVGSSTNPAIIKAWKSDDSGYAGFAGVTIDGSSLSAGSSVFVDTGISKNLYIKFYGLRLSNAPQSGAYLPVSYYTAWYDCRFDNNGLYGAQIIKGADMVCCEFDNNSSRGAVAYGGIIDRCRFHHNNEGLYEYGVKTISRSLFYRNSSHGVTWTHGGKFIYCVFADNAGNGINNQHVSTTFINCIIAFNGAYGLAGSSSAMAINENNLFYNNTSGDTDSNNDIGNNSITGQDPLFVSRTDGSEDYSLQPGSPAKELLMTIPSGGTAPELQSYPNAGAYQHKAGSSAMGTFFKNF